MTNTAGFRRMKARKQKLEDHYDISIDACGNAVKVKKAIKQAKQKNGRENCGGVLSIQ
ncbi:hypothetical protein [Secundilactobacillus collinoides]|uniref:hypothetical protein n=1 Tax=Secundilactobacillus collinoides TaxID=33960 RepID=UPI000AD1DF18|nr:hypothetical protein [Secundilactobacillus collinoides]